MTRLGVSSGVALRPPLPGFALAVPPSAEEQPTMFMHAKEL